MRLAVRLKAMGSPRDQKDGAPPTSGPGFGVTMHRDLLRQPMSWRAPAMVFVCSMADLFPPAVEDDFIARAFSVMASSPRHTYQVLTKRHARLRALLTRPNFRQQVHTHAGRLSSSPGSATFTWPLPNVWVGVSVEEIVGEVVPTSGAVPSIVVCVGAVASVGEIRVFVASVGEVSVGETKVGDVSICLLYTSPSPRDRTRSRMPSSA